MKVRGWFAVMHLLRLGTCLRRGFGRLAAALLCLALPAAHAAVITVNNTHDNGAGSLRYAIQAAASGDMIDFSVLGVITLTNGGLLITNDLAIIGPGAPNLAVSGNNGNRVFEIASNVTASISDLTIRDGHASDGAYGFPGNNGGGLYNAGRLTLSSCSISGNTAGSGHADCCPAPAGGAGGGVYNAGTLTIIACSVSGNTAGSGHFGGYPGGPGGGIYSLGALTLISSTVSGNRGGQGGNGANGNFGHPPGYPGGIGGDGGGVFNAGTLTVTACTLSRNAAGGGGPGGRGVFGYGNGRRGSGGNGGGTFNAAGASANVRSTLVALDSVGGAGVFAGSGPDLFGSLASQGHNLIGQTNGGIGFKNGVNHDLAGTSATPLDPLLGPLQNNGGPTFTMGLLPGSPALNAGDDALLAAPFNLTTDQRGLPRKFGPHVDIGAFELQEASLADSRILPDGRFRFALVGQPGTAYTIQASTDFLTWTALTNFVSATGTNQFTDAGAPNFNRRFYRAVSQ